MITFFLLDLDGGGAERAIVNLTGSIAALGHDVTLVVGDANSDYRTEVSNQVRLINFQTRSPTTIFKRLIAFLRKEKPTTIMSALDPANIMLVSAAYLTGFKGRLVVSQRAVLNASLGELGKTRRLLTKLLLRICFSRADAAISNSRAATKELIKSLKTPTKKVFTIQNSIDCERIRRLASESKTRIPENTPLIISVGSLTPRKDIATLVNAFAIVRENRPAKLVIIGKGPEQNRLEQLIEEYGLTNDVIMQGFESNPYPWLSAASVFVSTSKGEGFPNVIAEALALGCQIVATNCPGDTADLLGQGEWGRLTTIGDVHGIAGAIKAALDAPLPADGTERAEQFSPKIVTEAYLNVLLANQFNNS